MHDSAFITRVVLKNYKSIAACDVQLGPLMFLVGRNGAGKSNFLDALRLVTDALTTSLDHALRDRGGINEVRRRSAGHPTHFEIYLEFQLPNEQAGFYRFKIGSQPQGGYEVAKEECRIRPPGLSSRDFFFRVESGVVKESSLSVAPAATADRLFLVHAGGLPEFRPLYDALSTMGFYNLNPARIRDLQPPDAGKVLSRDGDNLASVLGVLGSHNRGAKDRIEEYLSHVVPGVKNVNVRHVGPKETLEFGQEMGNNEHPWQFLAANMSDGTLRTLGILVALFQSANGHAQGVPLVGIEEPEIALHPAAAGVLRDSLQEASESTQVLVTSHSPDLLDDPDIQDRQILPVVSEQGVTKIAPLDEAGREAIRQHLYTAGELLRLDQLTPDPEEAQRAIQSQGQLFGEQEE